MQQTSRNILPPDDRTPANYAPSLPGCMEIFVKRPIRRVAYPVYKFFVNKWLDRQYRTLCRFNVDQWLWGQRGNDFEAHRRRINTLMTLHGKNLLIAGCGTGRDIVSWLPYQPASVTGVDYFRYDRAWSLMQQQASDKYPHVKLDFAQSDLSHVEGFASASFDLVGSDAVFEHIRHLPSVLSELYRLLRSGGMLYATYGPLWYCWGGDHISGYDAIHSGYNHLVLDCAAYSDYLDTLGTFTHSEHDGRTWIENDLFSYLRPTQYLELLEQAGFRREYVALIIEPRAIKCLSENPMLASTLLGQHAEFDLIVTGMTVIYRKPDASIHEKE